MAAGWASKTAATAGSVKPGAVGFRSDRAVLGIPVPLEIGDQRRTEVAISLFAGIDRRVAAEEIERLFESNHGLEATPPVNVTSDQVKAREAARAGAQAGSNS